MLGKGVGIVVVFFSREICPSCRKITEWRSSPSSWASAPPPRSHPRNAGSCAPAPPQSGSSAAKGAARARGDAASGAGRPTAAGAGVASGRGLCSSRTATTTRVCLETFSQ